MKIKQYLKALREKEIKVKKHPIQSLKTQFKGLRWSFLSRVKDKLSLFNKVPLSALFVVLVIALSLTVLMANKVRMQHFANVIQGSYPELTQQPMTSEGKPIGQNVIDRVLTEFNSINAVGYFVLWGITFRQFLKSIWHNHNPRKTQILGRV